MHQPRKNIHGFFFRYPPLNDINNVHGHFSINIIKEIQKQNMVLRIIDQINELLLCESCLVGKQHQRKFLTKSGARANKLLENFITLYLIERMKT